MLLLTTLPKYISINSLIKAAAPYKGIIFAGTTIAIAGIALYKSQKVRNFCFNKYFVSALVGVSAIALGAYHGQFNTFVNYASSFPYAETFNNLSSYCVSTLAPAVGNFATTCLSQPFMIIPAMHIGAEIYKDLTETKDKMISTMLDTLILCVGLTIMFENHFADMHKYASGFTSYISSISHIKQSAACTHLISALNYINLDVGYNIARSTMFMPEYIIGAIKGMFKQQPGRDGIFKKTTGAISDATYNFSLEFIKYAFMMKDAGMMLCAMAGAAKYGVRSLLRKDHSWKRCFAETMIGAANLASYVLFIPKTMTSVIDTTLIAFGIEMTESLAREGSTTAGFTLN